MHNKASSVRSSRKLYHYHYADSNWLYWTMVDKTLQIWASWSVVVVVRFLLYCSYQARSTFAHLSGTSIAIYWTWKTDYSVWSRGLNYELVSACRRWLFTNLNRSPISLSCWSRVKYVTYENDGNFFSFEITSISFWPMACFCSFLHYTLWLKWPPFFFFRRTFSALLSYAAPKSPSNGSHHTFCISLRTGNLFTLDSLVTLFKPFWHRPTDQTSNSAYFSFSCFVVCCWHGQI